MQIDCHNELPCGPCSEGAVTQRNRNICVRNSLRIFYFVTDLRAYCTTKLGIKTHLLCMSTYCCFTVGSADGNDHCDCKLGC